ncbi:MAG: Chaperonin 10 Kd subunit [Pseudomonadota bacterium]|jgi:co-chaperonin GroES (HSP10)
MNMSEPVASNEAALREAFPEVDPGASPVGGRILVQWRQTIKKTTASGIVLVEETKETEKWNNQVAKVIAVGPLAFKKRDTLEPWPEGNWVEVGDYVRVPKWGGDRWEVPFGDPAIGETALFSVFNDHEVIAKVTGDPLKVRAFL